MSRVPQMRGHRRLVLISILVIVGSVIAAALWISRHHRTDAPSATNCEIVADVAREWRAAGEASSGAAMQPGAVENPERWSALADKSRQAANSVSSSELKSNLLSLSDGFDEYAAGVRDSGTGSRDARFQRFLDTTRKISEAADKLQTACPNIATPSAPGN